jgi:predicted HicB family RNase H-like nuclease
MEKQLEVYRRACDALEKSPDWATFFREVLGVDGIVKRMYPTPQEFAEFEKTNEYAEIQAMLVKLREKNLDKSPGSEPTRVITIRLPKSMQDALNLEAEERETSVNQLCISKLLQWIEKDLIPGANLPHKKKRRRRKQTPQQVEAMAEAR